MGLLSGLIGNASSVNIEKIRDQYGELFLDDENIELAFKLIRDLIVFTDRRLIFVDKQGLTGKKKEFLSIPYKSIARFSLETAGHFDLDCELKIWISSEKTPSIEKTFSSGTDVYAIERAITAHTCK